MLGTKRGVQRLSSKLARACSTSAPKMIFSGIQPTGDVHLGNYLGAISHWVELQKAAQTTTIYSIVDLHAITVPQDPAELKRASREMACTLLACGIDPKKSSLFVQSQVREHTELAWILGCSTPFNLLNTMTQFKDKSATHKTGTRLGLFAYPVLMTADILLYRATHVPVGADQTQHLELAAKLARSFNVHYNTDFFPSPAPIIDQGASVRRVMSLRDGTKKMSKSDPAVNSRIHLTDSADLIRTKISKAKTDSEPGVSIDPAARPEITNLINIYAALSGRSADDIVAQYGTTVQKSGFKQDLTEIVVQHICPIGEEMKRLSADPCYVDQILLDGADRARTIAAANMEEVRGIVGLG